MKRVVWLLFLIMTWSPAHAATFEEFVNKGAAAVERKNYKGAAQAFEEALKSAPNNAKVHLLLGLTYANLGQFDKAIEHSLEAVKNEPSYAGYNNLGLVYANKGDYDKAVANFEKATELNPKGYRSWYQLGLVQLGRGQWAKAVEAYSKSIEANANFAQAHLGLASAYYWSGDPGKAREQVDALKAKKFKEEAVQLQGWLESKNKPSAG